MPSARQSDVVDPRDISTPALRALFARWRSCAERQDGASAGLGEGCCVPSVDRFGAAVPTGWSAIAMFPIPEERGADAVSRFRAGLISMFRTDPHDGPRTHADGLIEGPPLLSLCLSCLVDRRRPFVGRVDGLDSTGRSLRHEHLYLPLTKSGTRVDMVLVAGCESP